MRHPSFSVFWLGVVSFALVSPSPAASPAEVNRIRDWYQGKTITLVVPHGVGGGFDTYARLVAPFFRKYIPGVDVVVRNVTGAGGLRGRNQVYTARPDGLTIGFTTGTGMIFSAWSGLDGVRFDLGTINHIGRIAYETNVLALSARGPFASFEDVRKARRPIRLGFSGVGSDDYYTTAIVARYFGYKTDPITGYSGSREANLAAIRGEVDGVQVQASSLMPLLRSGDLIPALTLGHRRDPALPDVPTALELADTPEARVVTATLADVYGADRIFFAPPDMAPSLLDVLRRTFDKIVEDREFLEHASRAKRPVSPLKGEDVERLVRNTLQEPKLQPIVREIAQQVR